MRAEVPADREMPLMAHLEELKRRLVYCAVVMAVTTGTAFAFHAQIIELLQAPAHSLDSFEGMIRTELTEFWGAAVKVSLLTGFALALPFFLFQAVRFVSPGLKPHERRYLYLLIPGGLLSFAAGVAFGYFVLIPPAIRFLIEFGSGVAEPMIRIGSYVSTLSMLLVWMGFIFQLPIVMFLMTKIGVVTPAFIARQRRWAIVLAFVLGAVISPTIDPLNQTLVAVPIIALYEVGYWLSRLGARGSTRTRTADAAA